MFDQFAGPIIGAGVILVCGMGLSTIYVFQKHRTYERRRREERRIFWAAIPKTAQALAKSGPITAAEWTRTLELFYQDGYTLDEAKDLIAKFPRMGQ